MVLPATAAPRAGSHPDSSGSVPGHGLVQQRRRRGAFRVSSDRAKNERDNAHTSRNQTIVEAGVRLSQDRAVIPGCSPASYPHCTVQSSLSGPVPETGRSHLLKASHTTCAPIPRAPALFWPCTLNANASKPAHFAFRLCILNTSTDADAHTFASTILVVR